MDKALPCIDRRSRIGVRDDVDWVLMLNNVSIQVEDIALFEYFIGGYSYNPMLYKSVYVKYHRYENNSQTIQR